MRNNTCRKPKRRFFPKAIVIGLMAALASLILSGTNGLASETMTPPDSVKKKIGFAYGNLPLYFIQNDGQMNKRVKFYEKGSGHATYFTDEGIYLSLSRVKDAPAKGLDENIKEPQTEKTEREWVKLFPLNANQNVEIIATGLLEGKINYLKGNDSEQWLTNIPTYEAVVYKEIYPGIDMKFYGNNRQLEYDIIIKPGADFAKVQLAYEGIEGLSTTPEGRMEIRLKHGKIFQKKPYIYQMIDGKHVEVEGEFKIHNSESKSGGSQHKYGFEIASYDSSKPLFIDPVLVYSTYLGGSGGDRASAIAVDGLGNAYVAGYTTSTDFPVLNALYPSTGGAYDVFVTKLNASGSALVYSTYLGGSNADFTSAIAVDSSGNAYVVGYTSSTDFPVINALYPSNAGGEDAFVTKLNASGSALVYSTYLGTIGPDEAYAIAVDSLDNAYVAGYASSTGFPVINALYPSNAGGDDAFVTKLNASGSTLVYSTYLGGSGGDRASAIAVDDLGNAYISGWTTSSDFPVFNALYPSNAGGAHDTYVTKLNASGSALVYSTYLGGSNADLTYAIAVDSLDNAYVAGYTTSTDFPVLNALYPSNAGGTYDAYVTKLNASGSALVYSTYLGGSNADFAWAIAVDDLGNAYIAGRTNSTDFPVFDALYSSNAGGNDAYVTELNASGSALVYSTYLGGSSNENYLAIAVDDLGDVYVAGRTQSTDFPIFEALYPSNAGGEDAFVLKIGNLPAKLLSIDVTPVNPMIDSGESLKFSAIGNYSDGSSTVLISGNDSWLSRSSMMTPRQELGVGVINGVVYATGGATGPGGFLETVESYDPAINTWTDRASMLATRAGHGVGVVNGKLYAVGGYNSVATLSSVEEFDPLTDTWTGKTAMPTARSGLSVEVVDGILYAIGGSILSTVEAYDPVSDTWVTKAPMPTARMKLTTAVVDGIIYAIGGHATSCCIYSVVEAYNPATDTWVTKAPMPTAREGLTAGVLDGKIFVVGGFNGSTLGDVEAYDPGTDSWSGMPPIPTARHFLGVGVVDRILYAIGGLSSFSVRLTSVEAFAPSGEVTWAVGDSSVATIDVAGLLKGENAGVTTVTATSAGISGSTSVEVLSVNNNPMASDDTLNTLEDTTATGTLVANDIDGDILTYILVTDGGLGSVVITGTATGAYTYYPNANANGIDTFTFKANDGLADSNVATITVTIDPVNDAPVADAGGPYHGVKRTALTFDGSGSYDVDTNDTLSYLWDFGDGNTATGINPQHTYRKHGTYVVTLTVSDGGLSSTQTTFAEIGKK